MVAIISSGYSGLLRSSAAQLGMGGLLGSSALGRGGVNVFVNAASGNLTIDRDDEVLIGRGPDATFGWQYNTSNLQSTLTTTGPAWNSKRRESIGHNSGGMWRHRDSDFQTSVFYYDATRGTYLNNEGGGAHDEMLSEGNGVWRDGDSLIRETYDVNLRTLAQTDTDGNALAYSRIGPDPTKLTTADGGSLDFVFDASGRVSHIVTNYTDRYGVARSKIRTRYSWDSYGRLASVTTDLTPEDNSIADGKIYTTSYSYYGTTAYLSAITQTDGSRLDIGYDTNGRVNSYSETSSAGVVRQTTLTYETDANGNKFTRVRDAQQRDTLLYYDAKGQLTKVVAPSPVPGAPPPTTSYAYNASGDLTSVTDAYGRVTSYTHDSRGNVTSITDSTGAVTNRRYSSLNRLLAEWRTASDASGTDVVQTTRYAYDSEQHLRFAISAEGRVTEYRYTPAGEVEFIIEYPEHHYDVSGLATAQDLTEAQMETWRNGLGDRSSTKVTYNTYDARGNVTSTTVYGIGTYGGAGATSEGYSKTSFVYDEGGRLVSRQKEGHLAESFSYDGMGRLVSSTDSNNATTTVVYNDAATQTVVTLASGLVKTSTFNKAGELLSVTESGSFVAGGTATFKYDSLGLARMTTDASGFNTYHLYDKDRRRVADINHAGFLTEYRYDADHRPIATMRYKNAVASGWLTSLADPNSAIELATVRPAYDAADICAWTFYDSNGRVSATVDGSGAVQSLSYDKAGRLVKSVNFHNKLAASVTAAFKIDTPLTFTLPGTDSRDSIARNFYDKDGRLLATLDGEGYLRRNIYDKAGQKVEEIAYLNATNAGYRASGSLNELIATQPAHADDRRTRFVHDGRGLLRYQVDGLNQVTELRYDAAGQVTSTHRYAGSIAATTDYTYDNVKALVASAGLDNLAGTRRSWSVYDAAGRLGFSIDAENGVNRFIYDNRGQVARTVQYAARLPGTGQTSLPTFATMDNWGIANDGDAANRVTRHYYSARGELRFTIDAEGYVSRTDFDAAGRTTREVKWDSKLAGVTDGWTIDTVNNAANAAGSWADTQFFYSFGGALTEVRNGADNRTHYSYNANGTLASKWVAESDPSQISYTSYQYDGAGRVVAEHLASGTADQASTYHAYDGLGNLISVTDPRNNVTTRTYDKAGRVLTETNAAGTVSFLYNAFGEAVRRTDARNNFTQTAYDRLGRVVTSTDALNVSTTNAYNSFGDLVSVTRGAAVTSFEYDRLGRVTRTTDAEGHYELYGLDAWGNRTSVRNKIGGNVYNSYDRRGLLLAETLPMQSVDSYGNVVAASVTNKFEYDARGNRTKKIEAFGLAEARTTVYVYDKANRLVETRGDAVSTMNADWVGSTAATPTEKLKYDSLGRVIERTDALGARTLYYYDRLSRVSVEIGPGGTFTEFDHDKNGNLVRRRVYATAVALPATVPSPEPAAPGGEYRETTHEYDALNRMTKTIVSGIRTGAWVNGTYSTTASATVTTTVDYDPNGNVKRIVDGNGNASFAFYDAENRKIAEVDRESYLTFYTLDGEGNVTQEDRYATQVSGVTVNSDALALRAAVAGGGARTTQFGYDKNGRRLTETRLNVSSHALDGNGALVGGAVHATIQYAYNGLGEVTQKTEANGDYVTYAYDSTGRLTQESRAPYVDQNGATVRPTLAYSYNGLNELSHTRQGGLTAAAGDRVTRYTYGAGGRVATMTDANGATYTYYYDAAGNVMRESYSRYKADGSSTLDSLLYTRDTLGRVTSQGLASWNGSAWIHGDRQKTAYNAYGDVSQRGVNDLWQEQLTYDTAGRLVKSNSGDGVWRFFAYDGANNRTLTIESEGTDLAGYTVDQAIAAASAGGSVGASYVDGINATISVFDRRGLETATRLPFRQLNASITQTLSSARAYNAYGEVTAETDARGHTTYFAYDSMGRLKQRALPAVSYTSANGTVGTAQPIESYYYDISGRMIATDDANGNRIRRALLAGTGHGSSEALVTAEYHSDGGVFRTYYDVFGDARILRDELGYDETRTYDAMGRITQSTHRGGLLADHYAYDLLGQRIKHWNSVLGSGNVEVTDYDMQGRVTRNTVFGGDTTTTSYSWNGAIATSGLGTFGGWSKTTSRAGVSSSLQIDLFGRDVSKSDFAGRAYSYSYDKAGRLTAQTGPGQSQTHSYFNTGRAYQTVDSPGVGYGVTSTFGYDAAGNRTYEGHYSAGSGTLQNATIDYDSNGRMTAFTDRDGAGAVRRTFTNQYDLAGNIRRSTSSFPNVAYPQYADYTTDQWFAYDSMNRMTIANGQLSGGTIVAGNTGIALTYDAAGRRRTATQQVALVGYVEVWVPDGDPGPPYEYEVPIGSENGHWETQQSNYMGLRREEYDYRADGYLMDIRFAEEGYYDGGGYAVSNGVMGAATLRAINARDYMGRVTQYQEFGSAGDVTYNRYSIAYDAASRVTSEVLSQKRLEGSWHTYTTTTTNTYAGAGGALSYSAATTYNSWYNGSQTTYSSTSYNYAWWDEARVSTSTHDSNTSSGSNPLFTSTYTYDGLGRLASVYIADGRPRTVTFTNNPNGQILSRIETSAAAKNPADYYYFVDGVQVGELTNNGNHDLTRATYSETFVTRNWNFNQNLTSQPFRWNTTGGVTRGQFGGSGYDPISPTSQGMEGTDGRYTVREGDTLGGIAQQLWGDGSLWYMIAEANGLSGGQSPAAGTSLIVPDKVTNIHNSARTFEVYDPNRALGDLSPTAAKPPKKAGKCGMFGQILLVVIAVAVTALTYGALTGPTTGLLGTVLAGAASSAAGSIVSQGFGVATGIQDKFSWKGVAMAALSGAVGGGVGSVMKGAMLGSQFLGDVVRGAVGSALTQGIGVAVGLQKKFDFAAVAAAGVGAGIVGAVSRHMADKGLGVRPENITQDTVRNAAFYANQALSGAAGALASAATRSLIDGSDFGDNILAALPDVIGTTIGNLIADPVVAKIDLAQERAHQAALARAAAAPADGEPTFFNAVLPEDDFPGEPQPAVITFVGDEPPGPEELLLLAQNPARGRMGHNGGPPLTDPRTGQVLGIPIMNGPLGPILAPIDGFLDITGPANRMTAELADAERRAIRRELRSLDPNWREPAAIRAAGPESLTAKLASLTTLREQRAFVRYRVLGDFGPLQQESLRVYQRLIDEGFALATGALRDGSLRIPRGMTREQVIGSRMDQHARTGMRNWYRLNGIQDGPTTAVQVRDVQVNRRMPTFERDAAYRIPDLRVANLVFDATLSPKNINTPQVRGYLTNPTTTRVVIVRPRAVGPSYYINRGGR